jgi:DegV family protein with EDD domain
LAADYEVGNMLCAAAELRRRLEHYQERVMVSPVGAGAAGWLATGIERNLSAFEGFPMYKPFPAKKGEIMSKVAIVTDSTAYLPSHVMMGYPITVLPQILIWGDEIFQDGVDIQPDEFYRKLETAKIMPTTSQVAVVTMKNTFESLVEAGYDVLGIFISAKLSGTMESATLARNMLPKAASKIAILDSNSTSMAMGFHILSAARAAQAGATLLECQKLAEEAQKHTGVYFVVDTLEFLRRGGRIGGAQAMLGSALNLKPLLELRDGRIEPVEKVRTKAKAIDRMIDHIVEQVANRPPVRLATLHANAEAEAESALAAAAARLSAAGLYPVEQILACVSPAIGSHSGPGTVGLAYMAGM